MVTFFASLALKHPGAARFLKKFGKWIAVTLIVIGLFVGFNSWLGGRERAAYDRGFSASEAVRIAELNLSNQASLRDERLMNKLAGIASVKTKDQVDNFVIKLSPYQKDIKDEVSKNSVYSDCVITDGVFNNSNSARGVVNASIDASNTGRAGPRPSTAQSTP